MKKWSRQQGMTLIELLLVTAIVGILAGAIIMTLNPIDQLAKSEDARRKSDLAQVQRALELYYQNTGRYPASSADFKIYINPTTYTWGSAWQPYMNKLPQDPKVTNRYLYYSPPSSNGQTYYLYANVVRGAKDTHACNAGNACTSLSNAGFPPATACGGTCNYGVSSANVSP